MELTLQTTVVKIQIMIHNAIIYTLIIIGTILLSKVENNK